MDRLEIRIENAVIYFKGPLVKSSEIKGIKIYNFLNLLNAFDKESLDFATNELKVDVSQITKVDTVGLASMMQWIREFNKFKIKLTFVNINEHVNYACKLYGVHKVLFDA